MRITELVGPYPLARFAVVYAAPILIPADADESSLEQKQLDEIFNLLRRQGYQPEDFVMTQQQ